MDIPNVKLVHHSISKDELFDNCSLVISAMGSSGLDAAFYGKPSIVFGEMFYTILPSVTYVEKLNDLPNTIRSSLQNTVRLEDVKKFESQNSNSKIDLE